MKKIIYFVLMNFTFALHAQSALDSIVPVRSFCIAAPAADGVDRFIDFINNELSEKKVNTLILRIDYNYQYTSRPELADKAGLDKKQVKKILLACRDNGIRLIPQINLLGHQSWHSKLGKLLEVYPEFDETPGIKLPDKYKWPNADALYCKSYCTLHPQVHKVVFDVVDEIVSVFEADAFHAGLDEVFYIGHRQCHRCKGKNKAKLFADEVSRIRNHLKKNNIALWMWGDRLIDGKLTGIGMWEASQNQTHYAIDSIPKDIVINDWHYGVAYPTAFYFAMKGFSVVSCSWRKDTVAISQLKQIVSYRNNTNNILKNRFKGVMHTVWSSNEDFLNAYYAMKHNKKTKDAQVQCFESLYKYISEL